MASLKALQQTIFEIEGIRVELRGKADTLADYWKTRLSGERTVAAFRERFIKKYPGLEIDLLDGVGMPAGGMYKLANLRATYDHAWIEKEYASTLALYQELMLDQKRTIKALKKALKKSPKAAKVKEDELDPYELLNLTPDASDDEIKLAHRDRIMAFHPDRFEKFGDYLKKFATEKAQQINAARDQIARLRNPDPAE